MVSRPSETDVTQSMIGGQKVPRILIGASGSPSNFKPYPFKMANSKMASTIGHHITSASSNPVTQLIA
jgi:hypothetical protein